MNGFKLHYVQLSVQAATLWVWKWLLPHRDWFLRMWLTTSLSGVIGTINPSNKIETPCCLEELTPPIKNSPPFAACLAHMITLNSPHLLALPSHINMTTMKRHHTFLLHPVPPVQTNSPSFSQSFNKHLLKCIFFKCLIHNYNPGQNIWSKIKKPSKTRQGRKSIL